MPRFDGPYFVTDMHKEASTITIDIPTQPNAFPTFHTSQNKCFHANNNEEFTSQALAEPGPIMVDGMEEYTVDKIIVHRKVGQYWVHFAGWGQEHEKWIAGCELEDNEALDLYWRAII